MARKSLTIEQQELGFLGFSMTSIASGATITLQKSKREMLRSWLLRFIRKFFITKWILEYNMNFFISDLIAGITMGLILIPQSIMFSNLCGLPSQYGLFSSLIASLTYVIFGSVKQMSIGPTSHMALLTLTLSQEKPIEYIFLLTFFAGCIELIMGILKLGKKWKRLVFKIFNT